MKIINQIRSEKRYIFECIAYWLKLRKYNASSYTNSDIEKMQYSISRLIHTIEKGMSLRNPRKGFGQDKVLGILQKLREYCDLYINEDKSFLNYPIETIESYIDYTKKCNVDIPQIENSYKSLLQKYGLNVNYKQKIGGVL